jgi:phage terminase large subunit-like protein
VPVSSARRPTRPPKRPRPPAPWYGTGADPADLWPGVSLRFDAEWSPRRARWETHEGRYYFDPDAAARACDFFPTFLTHHIGAFAGQRFALLEYQQKLLTRPLFGWKRASDGLRRFQKLFGFLPKGAGKSPWASGTGLYLTFCDGEPAAEVIALATDRQQARIVHDNAKIMLEDSPEFCSLAGIRKDDILKDTIIGRASRSSYIVLSSDAASAHGRRPHGLIFDEFHAQGNRDLFEALRKSMAKRRQPLLLIITHAGDDDESICYEEYDLAKRLLSGTSPNERTLPVIFEAGAGEDWTDPALWQRVNPGHGITIQHDGIASEAIEAQSEPRKLNDFLRFHLNRWVNQATAWLPLDWWDSCVEPVPPPEVLATLPCALGIDLAQKIHLAAVCAVFRLPLVDTPDTPIEIVATDETGQVVARTLSLNYRIAILPAFWLPEDTLRERVTQDRVPYDLWAAQGLLQVTPGTVIDADAIITYIRALVTRFPLLKQGEIGYDPAFATELAIRLTRDGLQPVELLQNYKQFSEASQVFEALVKARRVLHGGHRLLRWNVENVAIKRDDAGRIRPVRPRHATKRIDGVVAAIMALNRLIVQAPPAPPPVYDVFIL